MTAQEKVKRAVRHGWRASKWNRYCGRYYYRNVRGVGRVKLGITISGRLLVIR